MNKKLAGLVAMIVAIVLIAGTQMLWTKAGVIGAKKKSNPLESKITIIHNETHAVPLSSIGAKPINSSKDNRQNAALPQKSRNGVSRSASGFGSNSNEKANESYYKHKAIVLIYHHISNEPFSGITIKPERFEEDLKMLRDKGFNVIRFSELVMAMEGNKRLPDNAVVITFDDGLGSVYKYAYPLLKKYNTPAVSFLITSRNENYKEFKTADYPMSPEEISAMSSSGLVEFGSHTNQAHERVLINAQGKKGAKLTNRIYDKIKGTYESEQEYEKRVLEDLTQSRELIHQFTGAYPSSLCFPYGVYDKQVIQLAQKAGFQYFVTTQPGANYESSGKNKISRIRAGDAKLTTNELYRNILNAASRY